MKLKRGMKAPDFSVNDQDGNMVSLKDFKGKKLALYFYPKDNTPTCTEQACNLRDNISLLKKKGIVVLGVSVDCERKHKNFEKKFSLPFPLLADTEHQLVNAYGVWGEKMLFGRKYMGIHRVTFLINEQGKVDHVIDKVNAQDHAGQIIETWSV
ncbi:MAG TPA: thioredoxin-dependent thiol peroxidase [Flavipsychrobacter sp.]|nr:thioredoxin-dependent thiol peroxidase [Flavipsychrobacter sp.]